MIKKIEEAKTLPFFVFIFGGSCAGKTYLAQQLAERLGKRATTIGMDNYFKEVDDESLPMFAGRISFDLPGSYNLESLKNDLVKLKNGQSILMPTYDISKNKRLASTIVKPSDIVIVEGLYAGMVSEIIEKEEQKITVLVQAGSQSRLARRLRRDTLQFGWSPRDVVNHYSAVTEPIFKMYISKQKADVTIENNWRGEKNGK